MLVRWIRKPQNVKTIKKKPKSDKKTVYIEFVRQAMHSECGIDNNNESLTIMKTP